MKVVIGLVGESGAGKETVAGMIMKTLAPLRVIHTGPSRSVLIPTLELWGLPPTTENLQALPVVMEAQYGEGALARAFGIQLQDYWQSSVASAIVVDAIRWESDVQLIRSFPGSLIVSVIAPIEIRYERKKKRGEKPGEKNLSLEQFAKESLAETERAIKVIGERADIALENSGSLLELREKVVRFVNQHVRPLIRT